MYYFQSNCHTAVHVPAVMLGLTPVYNFRGPEKGKETNQLTADNLSN